MDKFVIKNCPNFMKHLNVCSLTWGKASCPPKQCSENNCLLKEIVLYCNNYKECCEIGGNCIDERLCSTCFLGGANELADDILSELEIEEVNNE